MSVVVAGASGLVGSALIRTLKSEGADVFGIDRSIVDLRNSLATEELILDIKPSVIIDAAAKVGGIGANQASPVEFLLDNLSIQNNLMSAAHLANVPKFVFLGSSCIYPRDCAQPIKEEFLMSGKLEASNSAYAVAKIAGLELLRSYRNQHRRNWISLMPTNLYGPFDNFNSKSAHVLPAMIRKFMDALEANDTKVTFWGSGTPRREFLHVDDLARAVILAIDKYDSDLHLNIGTGVDLTIKELSSLVASAVGFVGEVDWDLTMPDGTPRKVLDVSKISSLGWKPTIELESGIKSTALWYRENRHTGKVRQ
jgi:GDP-L-fucose synthase